MCSGAVVCRRRSGLRTWMAATAPLWKTRAGVDHRAGEPVRHAVPVAVHLNVVVEPDPAAPPFGVFEGRDGRR